MKNNALCVGDNQWKNVREKMFDNATLLLSFRRIFAHHEERGHLNVEHVSYAV